MSSLQPGSPDADRDTEDLQRVIAEASESLDVAYRPIDRGSAPEDPPEPRRWLFWSLVVGLALGIGWLSLAPSGPRTQPPPVVEADLRWAVAEVVEAVERHRTRHGGLPAPRDLHALLGPHLSYQITGAGYRVRGRRDGVSVVWDGTLPLGEWRRLELYEGGSPPP